MKTGREIFNLIESTHKRQDKLHDYVARTFITEDFGTRSQDEKDMEVAVKRELVRLQKFSAGCKKLLDAFDAATEKLRVGLAEK